MPPLSLLLSVVTPLPAAGPLLIHFAARARVRILKLLKYVKYNGLGHFSDPNSWLRGFFSFPQGGPIVLVYLKHA